MKASKAVAAKERKEKGETRKKKVKEEVDEFDMMAGDKSLNTSLSKKLKHSPVTSKKTFKLVTILTIMFRKRRRVRRRRILGVTQMLQEGTYLAATCLMLLVTLRLLPERERVERELLPQRQSSNL